MLIPISECLPFCIKPITGILHIGAHDCEERDAYDSIGITSDKVVWLEALPEKVAAQHGKRRIFQLVASDVDDQPVTFNVANNYQSSSILALGTHIQHHPHIHYTQQLALTTTRMDTFLARQGLNIADYNFLNLDIQGTELLALKGFGDLLKQVNYIYTEVNIEPVYVNCALLPELDTYLGTFGFTRVLTRMTEYNWGDAFYMRFG